ncbi:PaaI family thioesterase [Pseudenhygromyxa sp. WMMC2535]|uniref:PaaI family thioesterase n=1 Tax=Pseudenhygromyxa sp. WMMC2535 TaxID=2712867 RepID=UPI001C3CD473
MGLRFSSVDYDEVTAELEVFDGLLQPYGLVHGGVYCSIVETLASVGAAVNVLPEGKHTVGLDNTTSFLRAVRSGKLHGRARPLARGGRTQVWEVEIRDDEGRLAASGRVRMLVLAQGASVAGERVEVEALDLSR